MYRDEYSTSSTMHSASGHRALLGSGICVSANRSACAHVN